MELSIMNFKIYVTLPYKSLGMLLLLLGFTVFTFFLMARIRKKRMIKFANFAALRKVHGYRSLIPSPLLLISKLIIVTLLFLVATESIQINMVRPVANTDFVVAIDSSQSMVMPDYEPSRLEFAKRIALKWLSELPATTKISVIKFSEKATPVVPLTTNYFEVENGIKSIKVDMNTSGTALGDAIALATSILSASNKQRFVILITDGKSNTGMNVTDAIEDAREKNVVIYAIGIGATNATIKWEKEVEEILRKSGYSGNYTFSLSDLDEDTLRMMAEKTGGKAFVVTNETGFEEAFKNIVIRNERIPLNSDYYVLLFIVVMLVLELLLFSAHGAL